MVGKSCKGRDGRPFFTEPMRDFSSRDQRESFARSIATAKVPQIANDGTAEAAGTAIDRAHAAFPAWRDAPVRERSAVLIRAAGIMRRRRDELSGIIINELKNWIHFTGHHLLLRTTIYWPIRPPLQPPPGHCFSPLVFTARPHLVYRHRQFRHLRRFPGLLPQKTTVEWALQVEALWIYRIWPLQ